MVIDHRLAKLKGERCVRQMTPIITSWYEKLCHAHDMRPNDNKTLLAEMFIFPERREVPSATTTASTTAATTTPPETETTPPETETTPAEAVGTAATTSVGGDRKIIINLKDIYRCPATGIKKYF
jgi:hypothetical protein